MYKKICYLGLLTMLMSCTGIVNTKNEKRGTLTAAYQWVVSGEKRFPLDAETAQRAPYMQIVKGVSGEQVLTFLNPYKNAIYFYDYATAAYTRKIEYAKEGPNAVLKLESYFIKSEDSIYVYNKPLTELVLTNSLGHVKRRISLQVSGTPEWWRYYPQYIFSTVNPMIGAHGKLLLAGMSPFSIADSLIQKFNYTAAVDLESNNVEFFHTYPKELYGSNANWEDPTFMQPYPELSPTGELVYSFPVSHDLYIAEAGTEGYKLVYAGSNVAGDINSIDHEGKLNGKRTPNNVIRTHILHQDLYTAIRYDPYRNVYYRFMLQGIPDGAFSTSTRKKPIVVIIMDEQFSYLGETTIGTGEEWSWENSIVTPEGLAIEYIEVGENFDEEHLILKTFVLEKL